MGFIVFGGMLTKPRVYIGHKKYQFYLNDSTGTKSTVRKYNNSRTMLLSVWRIRTIKKRYKCKHLTQVTYNLFIDNLSKCIVHNVSGGIVSITNFVSQELFLKS